MNNEPVAWRTHYPSGWEYKDGNPPFELKENSQLLYTHPAKTYEDAIEECAQRAEAYAYMSENFNVLANELRAILRKAQEK